MTCYLVARIKIHDPDRYGKYTSAVMPILHQHGGQLLVAEDEPASLEGEWEGGKLIVITFPEREAALNWLNSPEYREVAEHRHAASDTVLVMAEAFT